MYVYRLEYREEFDIDTVELDEYNDDDFNVEIKDVKNVLDRKDGANATTNSDACIEIIDSDGEGDADDNNSVGTDTGAKPIDDDDVDSDGSFDVDAFFSSLEKGDGVAINRTAEADIVASPTQHPEPPTMVELPAPDGSSPVRLAIKQEAYDMSYDLVRRTTGAGIICDEDVQDGGIISSSDDEDSRQHIASPVRPKKTTECDNRGNGDIGDESTSDQMAAGPAPKKLKCTDDSNERAMNDVAQSNKRIYKAHVKLTYETHGIQLAEDLLAAARGHSRHDEPVLSHTQKRPDVNATSHTNKQKTNRTTATTIATSFRSIETDLCANASKQWNALSIMLDITQWNVDWIKNGYGDRLLMPAMKLEFESINECQR